MNPTALPYRVIALLMALLMFTTSVSFALDMHYCGGRLRSVGFFTGAKACTGEMDTAARPNCRHAERFADASDQILQKKKCCQNRTVQVESAQDRVVQVEGAGLSRPLQQFVTAFVYTFFRLPVEPAAESVHFAQYRPPLIPRDIPVLVQSFRL